MRKARIVFTKLAHKQFTKAPLFVKQTLLAWVDAVERLGLEQSRLTPGRHDEPLSGKRQGQRSVRLNRQWRAIYTTNDQGLLVLVTLLEVTPHDYRTR